MDYIHLFETVKKSPGLCLSEETYEEAAAFVLGCDAGNEWGLLTGFKEWLIVRLNYGNNLAWIGMVLRIAFPNGPVYWTGITAPKAENKIAIDTLFDLLIEFLRERKEPDGLTKIFERYLAWLHRQSWYDPDPQAEPPKKRSSSKRAKARPSRQRTKKQKPS
jgi:hypothetical protein